MTEQHSYSYSYHAYNLDILSQIPIMGFEPKPVIKADVHVRRGEVQESLPDAVNKGVLYQSTETEFLLQVDQVARYHVREGREIVVQLLGHASPADVSAFISGIVFGALMHQRRMLPIHASSVLYQDKCLILAGLSGAGKSTLAASVIQAGGMLMADDISVIDFTGERAAVYPAFPAIKIWEDSLKHLGLSSRDLEPVRGEIRKFYLPVSRFHRSPTPIHRMFVLSTHNKDIWESKEILGVDKFRLLKKHTYLFRGLPKTGLEQNHFILVNQLANQVPVTLITRPNFDFNTDKLISCLTETVSTG
jgi:hypothetical protein